MGWWSSVGCDRQYLGLGYFRLNAQPIQGWWNSVGCDSFRDEMYRSIKTLGITYGDVSYGDVSYGDKMYWDVTYGDAYPCTVEKVAAAFFSTYIHCAGFYQNRFSSVILWGGHVGFPCKVLSISFYIHVYVTKFSALNRQFAILDVCVSWI